jgi:hypothetical protein
VCNLVLANLHQKNEWKHERKRKKKKEEKEKKIENEEINKQRWWTNKW